MKIASSIARKVQLTELERLDPITVFLEDFERGKGKILIECYSESWSAYWGGMGKRNIVEFFCSCDQHYLAKNLSNINPHIPDYDQVQKDIRTGVCKLRRSKKIGDFEARNMFDDAALFESQTEMWWNPEQMVTAYGEDWMHGILPQKPNPKYEYLCRVINAVKAGLKQYSAQ